MACLDDNAINAYLEARLPADELARAGAGARPTSRDAWLAKHR